MQKSFLDIFGIQIIQGSIANIISRFAQKAEPIYMRIKAISIAVDVIGFDVTEAVVYGQKGWFWIWYNLLNTFSSFSHCKWFDTFEDMFPSVLSILQSYSTAREYN